MHNAQPFTNFHLQLSFEAFNFSCSMHPLRFFAILNYHYIYIYIYRLIYSPAHIKTLDAFQTGEKYSNWDSRTWRMPYEYPQQHPNIVFIDFFRNNSYPKYVWFIRKESFHFHHFLTNFHIFVSQFTGISNNLNPIQFVNGFASQEDRLVDHFKQQSSLNRGHNFMRNSHQHSALPQTQSMQYDESNHQSRAKGLSNDDDVAISDEQILYFANINGNDNVKGNSNPFGYWTMDNNPIIILFWIIIVVIGQESSDLVKAFSVKNVSKIFHYYATFDVNIVHINNNNRMTHKTIFR